MLHRALRKAMDDTGSIKAITQHRVSKTSVRGCIKQCNSMQTMDKVLLPL